MRKIAILNQKGGSGKTTTAVNLSAALAEQGKKVLLMDLDPQASASMWFGFRGKGQPLFAVFTQKAEIEKAVIKQVLPLVDLLPSSAVLAGVEKALANQIGAEKVLSEAFEKIENPQWDYVFLDCPPTLNILATNALAFAYEVLVPVEAHVMALHGLVQLMKTLRYVQDRMNPRLKLNGILPCRVDFRTKHSTQVLDQLQKRYQDKVYRSIIRENIRLAEAPLHIMPITKYASKSSGAQDYHALAKEILDQGPRSFEEI